MYEAHFQLPKRPFLEFPDLSCFFAPEPIPEIIRELVLQLEDGQGFVVLTGPVGIGKTSFCRKIAAELGSRRRAIVLDHAGGPERRELLQSLLVSLQGTDDDLSEEKLRRAVRASFQELKVSARGAVLIVDDAHLLTSEQLDELWQLGSSSAGDEPVARVLLVGRSELERRLAEPALEALNQSIISHLCLEPLTERQSIDYVKFRIEWAGGGSSQIFTPRALERVALLCNGLPACLNSLCDHVLLLAFVQEQKWVTEEVVDDALIDVQHLPLPWNLPAAGQNVT